MAKQLPKIIEICPIIDSTIEIRFKSKIHYNAVFGLIYSKLSSDFKKVENLPILQVPEPIRMKDPNLKHKPLYKISNAEFAVQIGPDVLTVGCVPKYVGWRRFSNKIFSILDKVEELKIISEVERLGIRYINFFDQNIFDKIKLDISLSGEKIQDQKSVFRTQITKGKFICTLQVANDAKLNNVDGSIIDIDCYKTRGLQDFFKNKEELINDGHLKEKELFFNLLSDNLLEELKPQF